MKGCECFLNDANLAFFIDNSIVLFIFVRLLITMSGMFGCIKNILFLLAVLLLFLKVCFIAEHFFSSRV